MALQAGQLLMVRRQIILASGLNTVSTGITQPNLGLAPNAALFGADGTPAAPAGVASRVMVVPLAPLTAWENVVTGEPTLGDDGVVEVPFMNQGGDPVTVNVMFWDPNTIAGSVSADTYLNQTCEGPRYVDGGLQGNSADSGGANTIVFTLTNSPQVGSLILVYIGIGMASDFGSDLSTPTPQETGWTQQLVQGTDLGGGSGMKFALYTRISDGSESSVPFTFEWDPGITAGACGGITNFPRSGDVSPDVVFAPEPTSRTTPENPNTITGPSVDIPEDYAPAAQYTFWLTRTLTVFWQPGPDADPAYELGGIRNNSGVGVSVGVQGRQIAVAGPSGGMTSTNLANGVAMSCSIALPVVCTLGLGNIIFEPDVL